MAGGTGGHVFPGWPSPTCCASRLAPVVWLGNPDGMEASWCRSTATRWPGCASLRCAARGCCASCCCRSTCCAGSGRRKEGHPQVKPDVVLGMGGYITFPGGMMAR
jgi:UDP-N-acetylglucosamine--N-acetylmuramyl-(pentapeptide) pyrophosphoryl-undecaprenol N-acetylglucosamine transferase